MVNRLTKAVVISVDTIIFRFNEFPWIRRNCDDNAISNSRTNKLNKKNYHQFNFVIV